MEVVARGSKQGEVASSLLKLLVSTQDSSHFYSFGSQIFGKLN